MRSVWDTPWRRDNLPGESRSKAHSSRGVAFDTCLERLDGFVERKRNGGLQALTLDFINMNICKSGIHLRGSSNARCCRAASS